MKSAREHYLPFSPASITLFKELKVDFKNWGIPKAELDKRSGVKGWTIHDLRRTFSTTLAQLGIVPHIIDRLLHHATPGDTSDVAGVYNRYRYLPDLRISLEKYEAHLSSLGIDL
jgi:integrase